MATSILLAGLVQIELGERGLGRGAGVVGRCIGGVGIDEVLTGDMNRGLGKATAGSTANTRIGRALSTLLVFFRALTYR